MRNLMDCARLGIPAEIVPVLLLGMISPATTVGALVLHTAEGPERAGHRPGHEPRARR